MIDNIYVLNSETNLKVKQALPATATIAVDDNAEALRGFNGMFFYMLYCCN